MIMTRLQANIPCCNCYLFNDILRKDRTYTGRIVLLYQKIKNIFAKQKNTIHNRVVNGISMNNYKNYYKIHFKLLI